MCSAGDFYGAADGFTEPKSHFVAKMMGFLGYDAVGVGEMDLNYGLEKLQEDAEQYRLNLTCANLISKTEPEPAGRRSKGEVWTALQRELNTVFPPYRIVERDGVKFGFVGLLSPELKSKTAGSRGGEVEAITYTIKDPWEIAGRVLAEAGAHSDVLVLLAHMDRFDLEMKLPDHPEVDLVILGHNPKTSNSSEPVYIGEVPVYSATSQGQHVGNLRLSLDSDMNIVDTNNKVRFLGADVPDDPKVAAMTDAFDEEYRRTQKILFAKAQLKSSQSSGEGADIYLGLGSCMTCHPDAFKAYTQTGHARAYQTLSSQFVHRDANCVGCHVTGWGQPGGFSGIRRLGGQVDLIDVQCEACHGPGAEHSRDGRYLETARESCVKCHDREQDPDFDFDEAWKKIEH